MLSHWPQMMLFQNDLPLFKSEGMPKRWTVKLLRAELDEQGLDEAIQAKAASEVEPKRPVPELTHFAGESDEEDDLHAIVTYANDSAAVRCCLERSVELEARDSDGTTALAVASRFGHQHAVQALLMAKASANSCDHEGMTPLLAACLWVHECLNRPEQGPVAQLVAAEAKESAPSGYFGNPAAPSYPETVNLLLQYRADANFKSQPEDMSPLDCLFLQGRTAQTDESVSRCTELLLQAGAQPVTTNAGALVEVALDMGFVGAAGLLHKYTGQVIDLTRGSSEDEATSSDEEYCAEEDCGAKGGWRCQCNFQNHDDDESCDMCAVARPASCALCGLQKETMPRCSRCKQVTYCSVTCQRQAYKTHKLVCSPAKEPALAARSLQSTLSQEIDGPKKQKQPVLCVPNEYATIGAAIRAAAPGGCIAIAPGVYSERLVIDKPLKIIGVVGKDATIVTQSGEQSTVMYTASNGHIQGLSLRHAGKETDCVWAALAVVDGLDQHQRQQATRRVGLVLESCDLRSAAGAAMMTEGLETSVQLNDCRLHDSESAGLALSFGSKATVEGSVAEGNGTAGFAAQNGSHMTLRTSKSTNNQRGVAISGAQTQALVEDCELRGNRDYDLAISFKATKSNLLLERNDVGVVNDQWDASKPKCCQ